MQVFNTRHFRLRFPTILRVSVVGDSMAPTYGNGDWLVVGNGWPIRLGKTVLARDPRQPSRRIVKRVVELSRQGVWLLGDNPAASTDSRVFGWVPFALVSGPILFRYRRGEPQER